MGLTLFISYLASAFACSIVFFSLVRKFSATFAASGKRPTLYGILSSLVASCASFLSTFISENLFAVFWIMSGVFLVFGVIHYALTHHLYFKSKPENRQKIRAAELMFAMSVVMFTIVIFSVLQYYLRDPEYLFFPMMLSTLAFFLPILFQYSFEAAYSIPPPQYTPWVYPLHHPIDLPDEDPNEVLLVIGFEIAKKPTDPKRTYFRAKAPEGMKLGELFYHFINDYNELQSESVIEITNMSGEAYGWLFRTRAKGLSGSRILNPAFSIRENNIRENTVIIAERVEIANQKS